MLNLKRVHLNLLSCSMLSPDINDASYNLWHVANIFKMFLNSSDVLTMSAVRPGWSFNTTLVKELHRV